MRLHELDLVDYRMTKPKPKGTVRLIEARRRCHGVNDKLVVTLLPDGTLKVREQGRRLAVLLTWRRCTCAPSFRKSKSDNPGDGGGGDKLGVENAVAIVVL